MTVHASELYIGTYDSEKSRGIYRIFFDPVSGSMTEPELFYEASNAKWVSINGSFMALPTEAGGRAGTCFLKLREGAVVREKTILEERQTPCYILQKGDWVYTANYHEGNVMAYHLEDGEPSLIRRIENGARAGCHQILLHEDYLMVPCLEQNRIWMFDTGRAFAPAGEIRFPEGTGPRHGVFNREHTRFYVVSEWSCELFVFQVQGREFVPAGVKPVLPESEPVPAGSKPILPVHGQARDRKAAPAAIRLSGDERFLYISVRGTDMLAVFEIKGDRVDVIQHTSCGGVHPRDMILSGDERFLLVANRFEGGIVSMERNLENGLLGAIRHRVFMPEGVALAFAENSRR